MVLGWFRGCARSSGDWKKMQVVREKSMQLLLKTAEKILEHKKPLQLQPNLAWKAYGAGKPPFREDL